MLSGFLSSTKVLVEGKIQHDENCNNQFCVYDKLIDKHRLPAMTWIQYGEIFGDEIDYCHSEEVVLMWTEKCNLDNQVGIATGNGGWGYAG